MPDDEAIPPEEVVRGFLAHAIERREEVRLEGEGTALVVAGRPELAKWRALSTAAEVDADRGLVLAILATGDDFNEHDAMSEAQKERWPARGVMLGGRTYLAIPDPNRDEGVPGGTDCDVMLLAIVEPGNILDLDTDWKLGSAEGSPEPVAPPELSSTERLSLNLIRHLGPGVAAERLLFSGPYALIGDIVQRLGSDAIAELRRIIKAGTLGGPPGDG